MSVLQHWEGYVLEVGEDVFLARLVDAAGQCNDEEAEIYISEVVPEQRGLIELGAVFDWSISPLGTKIRFRRQPAWTQRELDDAQIQATKLMGLFGDA